MGQVYFALKLILPIVDFFMFKILKIIYRLVNLHINVLNFWNLEIKQWAYDYKLQSTFVNSRVFFSVGT